MSESTTVGTTKVATSGARQFQDVFASVIPFTVLLTEASIATGAAGLSSGDITVPGAALGDFVLMSPGADIVDGIVAATVTAADKVTVTLANLSGSAITALSSGVTFSGVVLKRGPVFDNPSAF